MARFGTRLAIVVVSACVALIGCKPKAGGKCNVGQALCESAGGVLACQGGVFVSSHCRGPNGCTKLGNKVTCDDSIADEGDTCLMSESENHACSVDKKKHLVCEDGKFKTVQLCRGPKACTMHGDLVTCDSHLAVKDDPCQKPGTFACSLDAKTRLICKDGKMAFDRYCRGQSGCRDSDFSCDESISEIGDPCGVPGMVGCSVDGKQEVVCQGGQYVAQRLCKKLGCHVTAKRGIDCQ
jgi:hypothetical protein